MKKFICKELDNKPFETKEALFAELKAKEQEIIDAKKSEPKETRSLELPLLQNYDFKAPFKTEKGYFYAIINTTNILDSHGDVHLPKIWNKSAKEQNGKTYYVADHELKINGVIVRPENVEIQLHKTTFKELGYDLEGSTVALVFKMPIDKIKNSAAKEIIDNQEQVENSIRMKYINLVLCIDSSNPDLKKEKENFDKYYPQVANKEKADELGYFWAILEGGIHKEGSMVLFGSNSATHIVYHQEEKADSKSLLHIEPFSENTQAKQLFIQNLI
jgi:hypothetical protein